MLSSRLKYVATGIRKAGIKGTAYCFRTAWHRILSGMAASHRRRCVHGGCEHDRGFTRAGGWAAPDIGTVDVNESPPQAILRGSSIASTPNISATSIRPLDTRFQGRNATSQVFGLVPGATVRRIPCRRNVAPGWLSARTTGVGRSTRVPAAPLFTTAEMVRTTVPVNRQRASSATLMGGVVRNHDHVHRGLTPSFTPSKAVTVMVVDSRP